MRAKVLSALYYPFAVIFISIALVSVILIFIVPKFQELYEGAGAKLPGPTMILVQGSYLIRYRAPWVLAGLVLLALILWQINKTNVGKHILDQIKLKLPVFGGLSSEIQRRPFARTSLPCSTGCSILQALVIVKDTSGNEVVARAMVDIHASIREGETIAEPMKSVRCFLLVIHMIAVGEETGAIEQSCSSGGSLRARSGRRGRRSTALIEPMLIVFLGILIVFIVIALYLRCSKSAT